MLRDSIKRHIRTVHKETKEGEDKTKIGQFFSKSLLTIVECPECEKTLTKKKLNRHIERAHTMKEERERKTMSVKDC